MNRPACFETCRQWYGEFTEKNPGFKILPSKSFFQSQRFLSAKIPGLFLLYYIFRFETNKLGIKNLCDDNMTTLQLRNEIPLVFLMRYTPFI